MVYDDGGSKTGFIPLSKYVTSSKQLTLEEEKGSVINYF